MNISIKKLSLGLAAFAFAVTALLVPVVPASAESSEQNGINSAKGDGVPDQLFGDGSIFTTIVNVMLFIIGAICVIMLIFGGIRYATSAGNATSVTAAKNTIMYALIGLVIAVLAYAIVNFVLTGVTTGNSTP